MMALKVISRLMDYPSQELIDHADELIAGVRGSQLTLTQQDELSQFIETLAGTDLYDAQERYDLLFERGRSLSLLLFEHVHGESRDRGQAMVDLLNEYQTNGFDIHSEQMPDYIPLFIEFLSTQDAAYVQEWLSDISHILTVLSERLLDRECDYRILFECLIELSGAQIERKKIAELVKKEQRDDTIEAIDQAWEDKEIRFDEPLQSDSNASCTGGYSPDQLQEAPITWHNEGQSASVKQP